MTMIERRFNPTEVNVSSKRITGTAAVHYDPEIEGTEFVLWDTPNGKAVERVCRGAFQLSDNLNTQNDVIACYCHDESKILGRTKSRTLKLNFTKRGMHYEIEPSDTTFYKDLCKMIKRGDVSGSSFAMLITEEEWHAENGVAVRSIKRGIVQDISLVPRSCYHGADDVMVRGKELDSIKDSHQKWQEEIETQVKILWSESL